MRSETKQYLLDFFEGKNFEGVSNGYVEVTIDDPQILDQVVDNGFNWGIEVLNEAVKESLAIPEIEVNLILPDRYLKPIGKLSAQDVGKLVKVRGIINMMGNIRPRCEKAVFYCRKCKSETLQVPQSNPFLLIPPFQCENTSLTAKGRNTTCKGKSFDLIPEASELRSTQEYMIQELPDDIKSQVPSLLRLLVLKKSLIKKVRCGDKVEIVGIVRAVNTVKKDRYTDIYLEVINIIRKKKDVDETVLLESDIAEIENLSRDPDLYAKMINSLAPSLHGMVLEKEASLLSIFGGVEKQFTDITRRGSIHILLVGDPSTGKSQLLRAVTSLAPSAMYSSGKGATAAGLTAAVIRLSNTENWSVFAGVMVLSDRGIACIDEIDKMSNEDRVAIHEAMEQQTVSINKANIHVTLPAKTTVISAANPSFGRYNIHKTISENIDNLPVTLLSRFDIILVLRDVPEKERDSAMTSHILSVETVKGLIERDLFKKYIIHAKRFKPKIGKEAGEHLRKKFLELRNRQNEDDPIPITARQFESLIRLSEAHARVFLRNEVTVEDADSAIRLLSESLRQTCYDVESGKQDIDRNEGIPKNKRDKLEKLMEIIKELSQFYGGKVHKDAIRQEANKVGISNSEFKTLFMILISTNRIYEGASDMFTPF